MNYHFVLLLLVCVAYAGIAGGAPERLAGAAMTAGVAATEIMLRTHERRWESVEVGVLVVDLVFLVFLVALAARANRFWPIWFAAIHLITVAAHAVKMADPEISRRAYAFASAFWSYPMLFLLALGTWNHRRRLQGLGGDVFWKSEQVGQVE